MIIKDGNLSRAALSFPLSTGSMTMLARMCSRAENTADAVNTNDYLDQCLSLIASSIERLEGLVSNAFTTSREETRKLVENVENRLVPITSK